MLQHYILVQATNTQLMWPIQTHCCSSSTTTSTVFSAAIFLFYYSSIDIALHSDWLVNALAVVNCTGSRREDQRAGDRVGVRRGARPRRPPRLSKRRRATTWATTTTQMAAAGAHHILRWILLVDSLALGGGALALALPLSQPHLMIERSPCLGFFCFFLLLLLSATPTIWLC